MLESMIPSSSAVYERFEENPFLPLFYKEMKDKVTSYNRYSFPTQMTFLDLRATRELELNDDKCHIIDRSLLEDRYIFGQLHIDEKFMDEKEIAQYIEHFELLLEKIEKPDVIIFLRADVEVLLKRIKNRGREMESNMSHEY